MKHLKLILLFLLIGLISSHFVLCNERTEVPAEELEFEESEEEQRETQHETEQEKEQEQQEKTHSESVVEEHNHNHQEAHTPPAVEHLATEEEILAGITETIWTKPKTATKFFGSKHAEGYGFWIDEKDWTSAQDIDQIREQPRIDLSFRTHDKSIFFVTSFEERGIRIEAAKIYVEENYKKIIKDPEFQIGEIRVVNNIRVAYFQIHGFAGEVPVIYQVLLYSTGFFAKNPDEGYTIMCSSYTFEAFFEHRSKMMDDIFSGFDAPKAKKVKKADVPAEKPTFAKDEEELQAIEDKKNRRAGSRRTTTKKPQRAKREKKDTKKDTRRDRRDRTSKKDTKKKN